MSGQNAAHGPDGVPRSLEDPRRDGAVGLGPDRAAAGDGDDGAAVVPGQGCRRQLRLGRCGRRRLLRRYGGRQRGVVAAGGSPGRAQGRDRHRDGVGRCRWRWSPCCRTAGTGCCRSRPRWPACSSRRSPRPCGPTGRDWCTARGCGRSTALDATAQELLFVIGPMLGALMVSFASPRAGLLAVRVDRGRGDLVVRSEAAAAGDRTTRTAGPGRPCAQLLVHRHRFALLFAFACLVTGFAAMSLGIVAFADEHGNRLIAGVLEMVAALGSRDRRPGRRCAARAARRRTSGDGCSR